MAFKQKFPKPPDKKKRKVERSSDVLDYQLSVKHNTWTVERYLADQIMIHVRKNNLKFSLDKLTRGEGNCFMIAVMQQLQQDHLYQGSSLLVQEIVNDFSHMKFREQVTKFIRNSSDPRILDI